MTTTQLLIALFIINLGLVFGAGLYETRIVLPLWFTKKPDGYIVNPDSMRDIDTGRKFWGFASTVPLTLLTIVNLVYAWQAEAPLHDWWLSASVIVLVERLSTFSFFIPTAIKLQKGNAPAEKVSTMVSSWLVLNYVRNALTLIALVVLLKAFLLS
ncbi:MAG: hypothetical protein K0R51_2652 [Cytophagaceae bacterium]|jgi:hypothetical protein|nr:hypothetical protein [Cytophagaceae bacterium]